MLAYGTSPSPPPPSAPIGIWAMPEPVTRTGPPRQRPRPIGVPTAMRSRFATSAIAGRPEFAGPVAGLAGVVLVVLAQTHGANAGARGRWVAHAGSTS
jgi:hypothetical protein